MRKLLLISLIMNLMFVNFGQQSKINEKHWSITDRLHESDFQMKMNGPDHNPCYAQFSMNYSVSGFDFMTKKFNQKIGCVMYRSASWLNEDASDKARLIYFQQVLFV